jgi:hypothetical protein
LLVMKRWELPPGAALLCGIPAIAIAAAQSAASNPEVLGAAILALIVADILLQLWKPSPARRLAFYVFAIAVPVAFWSLYIAAGIVSDGVPGIVEMWTGMPLVAGMWGFLLAFVVLPTPAPERSAA